MLATRAPEGDALEMVATLAIVEVVSELPQWREASLGVSGVLNLGADLRELGEQIEGMLQIRGHCSWGGQAVVGPPRSKRIDLSPGARLDPYDERQGQPYSGACDLRVRVACLQGLGGG